jgi:methyl-accepting chemotaxis protein
MNKMKTNTHNIITEIASVLDEMGNGNYIVSTQAEYVGEYETIEVSIEKIIDKMRETFHTIKNVSEQIDAGSEQLACAAQDLAEGCTTQATQVSGVVAAMQEMSASMELNAADAEVSVELSTEAGRILMEGNQKMSELTVAIEEISKCSEQIGTIISTIQDIADQTNLLSLNAAIEAARAGEAGRGFAVVAEQVKNLAEESAIAAGRTTTLIETTIEAVGKGILIAGETAADMARVMESAKLATDKMNAIAIKLKSDNEKVQKINETMTIVTEVVTDNSAASEETAAVSEEQKAQVETMVELMTQFNV